MWSSWGMGKKLNYCNGLGELWSDFHRSYVVNSLSVVNKFSIVVKAVIQNQTEKLVNLKNYDTVGCKESQF